MVALNKIVVPVGRVLAEMVMVVLEERGYQVFEISAATHEGLRPLSYAMAQRVLTARAAAAPDETARPILKPKAVDDAGFTVAEEPDGFRVRGDRPERWVRQTDFSNDEAVGYLADRLARLGIEEQLISLGAVPGSTVIVGGDDAVVFDWYPTIMAGDAPHAGPRGTDVRLDARLDELLGGDQA